MKTTLIALQVFSAGLIGAAGEWVTREDDGSRVCRLTAPLSTYHVLSPSFCADWTITPLVTGQALPSEEHGWVRCRRAAGCQLHIEGRGWRP